jgi:hypothetical protein
VSWEPITVAASGWASPALRGRRPRPARSRSRSPSATRPGAPRACPLTQLAEFRRGYVQGEVASSAPGGGYPKSERVSGGRLHIMYDDRPAPRCRQDRANVQRTPARRHRLGA